MGRGAAPSSGLVTLLFTVNLVEGGAWLYKE
jgi:hypothetical protein